MSPVDCGSSCVTFQPLTRQEIERRIQDVVCDVSTSVEQEQRSRSSADSFRWIAPADLVRRMRPHLVFN